MALNDSLNLVPNEPIRVAFLESGMRISDFARFMGMLRQLPDAQSARKLLGLAPDHGAKVRDGCAYRQRMAYKNAAKACLVLGVDPVDLGI